MRQPNPVQSVSQHRQQFNLQQVVGQAPAPPAVEQAQELAMEIYARLVVGRHLGSYATTADKGVLLQLAQDAQTAARIYFESMGVEFDG